MSDLTKLTADELRVRFCVLRPKMNVPARLVLAEITRRLERLETAEATAQAVQNELALTQEFLREAKERLEKCETLHMASEYHEDYGDVLWRQKQHDDDVKTLQVLDVLRKRLERCEHIIANCQQCRELLHND